MPLHVPTMFVMVMLATAFMGSALALIARRRHPDLNSWSGALFLQLLGYLLISLRGRIPDLMSIVAANAAITPSHTARRGKRVASTSVAMNVLSGSSAGKMTAAVVASTPRSITGYPPDTRCGHR